MPTFSSIRQSTPLYLEDFGAPLSQSVAASFEYPTLGERLADYVFRQNANLVDPTRLTAEQIKERIGDLPIKAEPGMSAVDLEVLVLRTEERLRRERIMSRARSDIGAQVVHFASGLAATMLDPVEIGVSMIPVVGQTKYAKMLSSASGAWGRAAVRARVGAAGGVVGNAIAEPFVYGLAQYAQEPYTLQDSFANIVYGGLLGGGLHVAGGAIKDRFTPPPPKQVRFRDYPMVKALDQVSPVTRRDALHTAYGQFAAGQRINIESVLDADPRWAYVNPNADAVLRRAADQYPGARNSAEPLLRRAVEEKQAQIDQQYQGRVLSKGERKQLEGRVKELEFEIEKSNKTASERKTGDALYHGAKAKAKKSGKELAEIRKTLDRDDKIRADRKRDTVEVERARKIIEQENRPDMNTWPVFLRSTLDDFLGEQHRLASRDKLQRAMDQANRQTDVENSWLYTPREDRLAVAEQVKQEVARTTDDAIDERLMDAQGAADEVAVRSGSEDELAKVREGFKEIDDEVAQINEALKNILACRSVNG